MATVYKSFTAEEAKSRSTTALSTQQKNQVNTILGSFMTYFKAKHS